MYCDIRYIAISTGFEHHVLNGNFCSIEDFNNKYKCRLLLVWDDRDPNIIDYIQRKWRKNIYKQVEYTLASMLIRYLSTLGCECHKTFIIIELSCNNVMDILTNIGVLYKRRTISSDILDFDTLRELSLAYISFDTIK